MGADVCAVEGKLALFLFQKKLLQIQEKSIMIVPKEILSTL